MDSCILVTISVVCCFELFISGLWASTLAELVKGRVSVGSHWESVSMSSSRLRLRRASFSLNLPKHDVYKTSTTLHGLHEVSPSSSNLTPDIQPPSKPLVLDPATVGANFVRVGNYLVSGEVKDTAAASSQASTSHHDAVNIVTEERFTCKVWLMS